MTHLKDAIVHFSWLTIHPQKECYFVQLLVSSHLQNSLKDCRRLTLEVACPRLPVRVLKRQNWAVSAPTVEKIGGAGGAKNAKHFKGYLTHMSQYIFQSIFLLIELKKFISKMYKKWRTFLECHSRQKQDQIGLDRSARSALDF